MSGAFSISHSTEWTVGRRLDRYELLGEIARGGMGTVLLARLAGAGGFSRLFAIKMLHAHLADDEHFVHMLLDEAHLASRIHHSNVVPVVDVCRSEQGLYVVMEYVDGFPFSQILASAALTDKERIAIGVQALLGVLGGLEAAHNLVDDNGAPLGLVHRDVSPQNVLVGIDGLARLADFGIARAAARLTVTEPGTLKGKLAYMAPESARGEPSDRRADVFCAGIMLWECLNGGRLFKADNEAQTLMRLLSERVVAPRASATGPAAALDAVCLKALERESDRRYASAHQMATALAAAAEQAGCLIAPIAVGDLLCARFATEIERRHAKIRGMRSSPSQPGLDLNAPLPAMATTYDGEGSGVSAFSLPIDVETSDATMIGHLSVAPPKVPIGVRAAAIAMVAAFVVAVVVLGGIAVYRGQSRHAAPMRAAAEVAGARPIVTALPPTSAAATAPANPARVATATANPARVATATANPARVATAPANPARVATAPANPAHLATAPANPAHLATAPANPTAAGAATTTASAPATATATATATPTPAAPTRAAADEAAKCAADASLCAPAREPAHPGHRHHTSAHHGHGSGVHGSPTLETNPYM